MRPLIYDEREDDAGESNEEVDGVGLCGPIEHDGEEVVVVRYGRASALQTTAVNLASGSRVDMTLGLLFVHLTCL